MIVVEVARVGQEEEKGKGWSMIKTTAVLYKRAPLFQKQTLLHNKPKHILSNETPKRRGEEAPSQPNALPNLEFVLLIGVSLSRKWMTLKMVTTTTDVSP